MGDDSVTKFDDATLAAYVDGEVDDETAREVELALERDTESQAFVRGVRESTALVRVALNEALHKPVPERILAVLEAPADTRRGRLRGAAPRRAALVEWRFALPLAAAFVTLMIGLGGGYVIANWRTDQNALVAERSRALVQTMVQRMVAEALENELSGSTVNWNDPGTGASVSVTPVRTYRHKNGQFCREFRLEMTRMGVLRTRHGLSCRSSKGVWETTHILPDGEIGGL